MKICSTARRLLASTCLATVVMAGANQAAAQSAGREIHFDIPAGDTAHALDAFSRQAGVQIMFPYSAAAQRSSRRLSGSFTRAEALQILTEGTGLAVVSDKGDTIVLNDSAGAGEAGPLDEPIGLEEVVVTAQKRETDLQNTPISISVLSADGLEQRHVESLVDLADGAIPSLRVNRTFARTSSLGIGMRGVAAGGDAQAARDSVVGVYLDGVYLGRAQGLGAALYDLERIEVLKGPQGTLFGRNSQVGAISMVTKGPPGRFGVDASAGISNYNGYKAEAHVNFPEVAGLSFKLDGLLLRRDGTIKNPASTGQLDFNAYDKKGAMARVRWRPTDNFSADYAYDYSWDGTTPTLTQLVAAGSSPLAPLVRVQPTRADSTPIGVPLQWSVGETKGHRLTLDWRASDHLTVRTISSYRQLTQSQYDNGAVVASVFAPNAPFSRYSIANIDQDQFSHELQVIGSLGDVEFVGGLFYYREEVADSSRTPNTLQWNATGTAYTTLSVNLDTVPRDRAAHVTTTSYGVFGQAQWTPAAFDRRLHVTAGGRFTNDAKDGSLDILNGAPPSYLDANGRTIVGIIPLDASWDHFDPLVVVSYDVSSDVNVYGKWSTGYRAGGANSRSLTFREFGPEELTSYELGLKSEFWERRVRLNVAAYYQELKDRQVDFAVRILPNNRVTTETVNAADGVSKGLEIDATIVPTQGLSISASYAYTKVELSDVLDPFTNLVQSGVATGVPKNAASVSVDYQRPVLGATFRAHVDANYSDPTFSNTGDPSGSDRMFLVNGRLALTDIRMRDDASLELALWCRNLLDESFIAARSINGVIGTLGVFNEPRTFGLDARVRF